MSSLHISSEPADVSIPAGTVAVSQARSDSRGPKLKTSNAVAGEEVGVIDC